MVLLRRALHLSSIFCVMALVRASHWSTPDNDEDKQIAALVSELQQAQENLKVFVTTSINELKALIGRAQGVNQQCRTSSSVNTCQNTAMAFHKYTKKLYNGCPLNYHRFEKSCYTVSSTPVGWWSAFRECYRRDAELMSIQSRAENDFVKGLLGQYHISNAWTAGNDQEREGAFQWGSSQAATSFSNWDNGQPNNLKNQDCLGMSAAGLWGDYACTAKIGFVCEKDAE